MNQSPNSRRPCMCPLDTILGDRLAQPGHVCLGPCGIKGEPPGLQYEIRQTDLGSIIVIINSDESEDSGPMLILNFG